MSSYYSSRKGVVNRYWKRPKPRVYECNIRDAERLYQQSYKDYLEAKEIAARKASADQLRSGEDYLSKIGYKRTNSLFDSPSDYSTRNGFESNDNDFSFTSRYLRSAENENTVGGRSFNTSSTLDSGSKFLENDKDIIDERVQRIQKLRSEMGLPSEAPGLSSRVRFQTPTIETDSQHSFILKNGSPDPRSRRGKTVDVSKSNYFSTQSNGTSRPSDILKTERFESHLFSENDKASKFKDYSIDNSDNCSTSENKFKMNGKESSYSDDIEKYSVKNSYKSKNLVCMESSQSDDLEKYSAKNTYRHSKMNGIESPSFSNDLERYTIKNALKNPKITNKTSYCDDFDKYSVKSTYKNSKLNTGKDSLFPDDLGKYSIKNVYKDSKKNLKDDFNDSVKSYESKNSTEFKSFKSNSKINEASFDDVHGCDDDDLLSNIKKKFPTSDEILQRVKKMDSEM